MYLNQSLRELLTCWNFVPADILIRISSYVREREKNGTNGEKILAQMSWLGQICNESFLQIGVELPVLTLLKYSSKNNNNLKNHLEQHSKCIAVLA